jgi:hypothetical protein
MGMKGNRKVGLVLLGGSATVLAALSERWSEIIGIDQSSGLIGMCVVYALLIGFTLHQSRSQASKDS